MRKRIKLTRTVLGFICLFLALGITFGLTPLLQRVSSGRVTVLRVSADIVEGSIIQESAVESVQVGGYNLPTNLANRKSDIVGKYVLADLRKGDFFLQSKLSSNAPARDVYLNNLPEGKEAISVSVKTYASGLSGKLLPGDIITAITLDSNKMAIMPMELQYVRVLAVTMTGGADKPANGEVPVEKDESKTPTVLTVTLLVNSRQAKRLVEMEASSLTHVILVCRGDSPKAERLLAEQEKLMEASPEAVVATTASAISAGEFGDGVQR